ncbi:DedA family protein [Priestia filamentosa]|jgi:membrane protein DedA with SNARE-associated domain|uniref:DedA family protein n=1 Tax=Priestia TaxID=2800373 RepID=UPI000DCA5DBF|nr:MULTISPECIES: DedA family protein [Priestia]MCY8230713.1 DedA family protein [Priestia endophytica]MED3726796.1 DedA family protein [Priestia filamentosa]RAS73959.1 alkaline phosphatase [Priestia endophytica]RPK12699.1 hypothetical protein FH5_02905 [Priestia endophytica]UOE59788.1 DedA family protein [Priestia filamentosa]
MEQMILDFIEYFKSLSYFGIMLALTFEFVPAELVLPLAGTWVQDGDMNLWLTVLAGTIGGVTGPLTLYAVGRYGGRPFLQRFGRFFFIKDKQINAADAFFQKHGAIVAFTGRFLPGIRTLISIPCGMAKMNVWVFSVYTFLAMLPTTFFYVYIGYKFGDQGKEIASKLLDEYKWEVILGVVVLIVIYALIKKKRKKAYEKYNVKDFTSKKTE